MTAPIRDMAGLLQALRNRRDELNISHETIDSISGLQSGYTSKLLAPKPIKNLGPVSFGPLLGALGLAVVVVEDQEGISKVQGRWIKRKRPHKPVALLDSVKREEILEKSGENGGFAFMQMIGKIGGKASGKTRRAKAMRRRELQRKRSHAARLRWNKGQQDARP